MVNIFLGILGKFDRESVEKFLMKFLVYFWQGFWKSIAKFFAKFLIWIIEILSVDWKLWEVMQQNFWGKIDENYLRFFRSLIECWNLKSFWKFLRAILELWQLLQFLGDVFWEIFRKVYVTSSKCNVFYNFQIFDGVSKLPLPLQLFFQKLMFSILMRYL